MDSPESTVDGSIKREELWITGEENLRLIHELLDPTFVAKEQGTGRSTRLALKYVELAIKQPGVRVVVEDHHPTKNATRNLLHLMGRLFDALKIDFEVHRSEMGDVFEVRAFPNGKTPSNW